MKGKSEREVTQSCSTLRDPMVCSLPGSSIHGNLITLDELIKMNNFTAYEFCAYNFMDDPANILKFLDFIFSLKT